MPSLMYKLWSMAAVVAALERIAAAAGDELTDELGRRRFSGHSFRVTGARWLAQLGLPIPLIMLLARWASQVVLRYVQTAPLAGLTEEYRRRAQQLPPPTCSAAPELSAPLTSAPSRAAMEPSTWTVLADKVAGLERRLAELASATAVPTLVQNRRPGVWHRALASKPCEPAVAACGWDFEFWRSHGPHLMAAALPPATEAGHICEKCLPQEKRSARAAQAGCSSSSSSSPPSSVDRAEEGTPASSSIR